MANFTDPIQAAFGRYLERFFNDVLVADTRGVADLLSRPFSEAAVWAPGRMIDMVDEMLDAYRKNDTAEAKQPKTKLPIMIGCMGKDFVPAPPEYARGLGDYVDVMIPDDPKQRLFQMRVVVADVRTQIAIVAADAPTAKSIAMQLHLYMSAIGNRMFHSIYKLAGFDERWPSMLEIPDIMAMSSPTDPVKNLTVLVADVQFRATVPFLKAPKAGQPSDGQGSGNTDNPFGPDYNPSGYLTVVEVHGKGHGPLLSSPPSSEWTVKTPDAP